MSPILICSLLCAALIVISWALSVVTREHSWIDRAWSIVPPIYVAIFWVEGGMRDPRLGVMTCLAVLWGVRLTFNFARKGGYAPGGEDYRWAELRKRMSPAAFAVFNVTFIAGFQNVLLLLIAMPAWAAHARPAPLGTLDTIATVLFVLFLAGETIADEQQWAFHRAKKAKAARGETADPPFLTTGLFRYSRHPNFFCEQGMWWSFYLFSVAAGAGALNPTILGALLLSLLFQGSTSFTEELTLAKYPTYAEYQRRTSRLIPWFPRGK